MKPNTRVLGPSGMSEPLYLLQVDTDGEVIT
jgi:hypothetical protein